MDDSIEMTAASRGDTGGFWPNRSTFPVVGLGASAGGLKALLRFFESVPADCGMAFVVMPHLSSKHQANAGAVLQRAARIPVIQVSEPTRIDKNHIYVVSPNRPVSISDGHLRLPEPARMRGSHVAIDLFFRALADEFRERTIGVVLSGSGSEGVTGLARVKEQGGVTFAQMPGEADQDGMPLAAIDIGVIDFVLPVAEIPQKLIDLWNNARSIRLPPMEAPALSTTAAFPQAAGKDEEEALQEVVALLRSSTGHDFRYYKRATVLRRIERRLQIRSVPDLPAYRDLLKEDPEESKALLKDLLIGVTNFFRDREAFDAIEREVIPQLFDGRQAGDQLRAWAAACSTGEEAYSLAILLVEHAKRLSQPPQIQVFATDIDEDSISFARAGLYQGTVQADMSSARLREFFTKEEARYRIKKVIRDRVLFATHDLLRDPPFSKLDLITCRNLLIYLNREAQAQVLEIFHFALNPGGFLFLGNSESAEMVSKFFVPVDKKNRIYRAKPLTGAVRSASGLPFGTMARLPVADAATIPVKRKVSFAEVHQRVLADHAPPSVIINRELNIVHMSDRAGRFLRHIGGEPSRNLVSLVRPELRLEVRTALFQAIQSGKTVEASRARVRHEDRTYRVNITARPFRDEDLGADLILVLFEEIEETNIEQIAASPGDAKDMAIARLEEELLRTKRDLQQTIEQSETSTDELRTSNEELQAINEELRSATEELETSKEELQSVNEELIAVNYELKAKAEETGKINDDLNNLIASTDIATIFIDRGMRIKRYTPRATDIFSIIPTDVGRSLLDITHRLNYEHLADDAETTFETLRLVEREVSSNDGRLYIARLLPYRTTEDRIEGAVLTFIDITARRHAEEKLRAEEERMRLVAESTKDYAIITSDTDGRITSWNKGAERIFGYTEEEVLGEMLDIIFLPEDRANGTPEDERRRARDDGRAEDERWHVRKDGTRFFCSGVLTPLRDGEFYGYAKIARDLTGRLQAGSQSSTRAETRAEKALKDEFLAVMSHELKHPLNLIHINAELLSRLPEVRNSPISIKAAETIRNASLSQAKIIDDLLDLTRANTGKLALALTDVDLTAVVNSIVDMVRGDPAAAGLAISVVDPQVPVIVRADLVRIEQVIWNLLSNSIKFTPFGGSISICLAKEGDMARLEVVDNGQGISPDFLPHVFEMFVQAAPTRVKGGLGIGLALVREIVELHHGRIKAESAGLGHGAKFSIWLPLYDASAVLPRRLDGDTDRGISGLRIMLVDDQEDVVNTFRMLLEFAGVSVITATSPVEALDLLADQRVDLVLSDIGMPEMDGYTFIKKVRKLPGYDKLPAIAVTGFGRLKDVEHAYEAGFSAHISKPVSMDALTDVVKKVLLRTKGEF